MISFNNTLPDRTIQIGDWGAVKNRFTANLRNPEAVIKPILMDVGRRFVITGFNKETESVLVDIKDGKESLMIEIPFSTLLESCLIDGTSNFEPIRCVHISHTIRTMISTKDVIFGIVIIVACVCGFLLGRI